MTIKIYISGLSGNYEVKKRQQRIQTVLDSCAIQYELIDITEAGCEDERKFMQETATAKEGERNPLPPQIFNDKDYCGDYDGFDVANETDQLHQFLKLSEGEVNTAQDILSANRRSSSREQTPMAENGIDHADNPEPPAAAEATEEDHVEPPDHAPVDDLEVKTDVEPEAAEQREENDSAVDAEDEGAKDSKVDDSNEGATDEKVATPEPEAPEEETVPATDAKADVEDDKEDKSGDEESEGEDDEDENPDLADLKAAAQRLSPDSAAAADGAASAASAAPPAESEPRPDTGDVPDGAPAENRADDEGRAEDEAAADQLENKDRAAKDAVGDKDAEAPQKQRLGDSVDDAKDGSDKPVAAGVEDDDGDATLSD